MPNSLVDSCLWHFSRTHEVLQIFVVQTADHVHVHACQKSLARCCRAIICDSMCDEFGDRREIAITIPANPHSLLRICFNVKGFAEAGTPFSELKELIRVAAP